MKNTLDGKSALVGVNSRLDTAGEKIIELEDVVIETMQNKTRDKK